jgi:hypothetical protein
MIEAFRIHIPDISETGPFQETDRFYLAPITERPFPLDTLTSLLSQNGKGLAKAKLASQVANVLCMKCRRGRVIGNWSAFQHCKPVLLFRARSLLRSFAHKSVRAACPHQGGKCFWFEHQTVP